VIGILALFLIPAQIIERILEMFKKQKHSSINEECANHSSDEGYLEKLRHDIIKLTVEKESWFAIKNQLIESNTNVKINCEGNKKLKRRA